MPLIPLLKTTAPTQDAAAPVMDRNQRPTLDTSAVQQGLGRLNEAKRQPLMDPRAMSAPWSAIASLGEAVQKTGSIVGAMALKDQEALGIKQFGGVQASWIKEQSNFETWKETHPPEEWLVEADRVLGKFNRELSQNTKLTVGAREHIDNFLTLDGATWRSDVEKASRKFIRGEASGSLKTAIADASNTQNRPLFDALVQKSEDGMYQYKFESDHQRDIYNAKGRENVKLQLDTFAASGDKEGAVRLLQDPVTIASFKGNEKEYDYLMETAPKAAEQQAWARTMEDDVAQDAKGTLIRLEDDKAFAQHYPGVTEPVRQKMMKTARSKIEYDDIIEQRRLVEAYAGGVRDFSKPPFIGIYASLSQARQREIDGMLKGAPANNDIEYRKFITKIDGTDLTDSLNGVKLEQQAQFMFDGPMLADVNDHIAKRMKGNKAPRAESDLFQEIDADLDNGAHGEFRVSGADIEIDEKTGQAFRRGRSGRWLGPNSGTIPGIPAGTPGWFRVSDGNRVPITLSEEDRMRWKAADQKARGVMIFDDVDARRAASTKAAGIKAKIEQVPGDVEDKRVEYYKQMGKPRQDQYLKLLKQREEGLIRPSGILPQNPDSKPEALVIPSTDSVNQILQLHGK